MAMATLQVVRHVRIAAFERIRAISLWRTALFADRITGETSSHTPIALAPGNNTVKVEHWAQSWYMGSLTPGVGKIVQTDTLQRYTDHAEHQDIATGIP